MGRLERSRARRPAGAAGHYVTLLVDNDANGVGQKAAGNCKRVWNAAGRTVTTLIPKQEGWDFNDVILRQSAA